jgi:ubiquitin C-terminal hydrolase
MTKKNFTYDLYAISNHYGSLNGGHYTAYCQNPIAKKWYEFDDASVSKVSDTNSLVEIENAIVSKSAYVLFYKLRKSLYT